MFKIESLLSARLFLQPQTAGDFIFFLSNISGHLSLYKMKIGGSVPQPLLPPDIALQNPHLIDGYSFAIFPKLKKILVMIDKDGEENYQPMLIPISGGYPEEILGGYFKSYRCHLGNFDVKQNIFYLANEEKEKPESATFQVDLNKNSIIEIFRSSGFSMAVCNTENHKKIAIIETFTVGDEILYLWESGKPEKTILIGTPISDRKPDEKIQLTGINGASFTKDEKGILISSAIYSDSYSVGYLDLKNIKELKRVKIKGLIHSGKGELDGISGLKEDQYTLSFNIDGISWLYQVSWKKDKKILKVERTICGGEPLEKGTLESFTFNPKKEQYALSFSSADLPTQILLVDVKTKTRHHFQTNEQVLGIPDHFLSAGEDASFVSYDGLRMSARLYLPCKDLRFKGPRPLVYYVHGGPQGQERPDFAWFSMPLIQYLTLKGFAVFVPNVRGSTGYGLAYTKLVDRDWGGNDRLDHIHALKILAKDKRIDTNRAGVVGRSYGGYMSLTLAGRHPKLWKAAVDMFGPYDLLTFLQRIPESWKPIMKESLGDTVSDREFLVERSPKTYLGNMTCPLLVIQGSHDPRVVALESQDLVDSLKAQGKKIDYILFEDEGHDVLKYKNRVRCYEAITEFFIKTLKPEK